MSQQATIGRNFEQPLRQPKEPMLINPPAEALGSANAVLTGSGKDYFVPDFEGSLSTKTVVSGSAVWEAGRRRFQVHENTYLILNDRQRYTMTIDSASRVTTFCLFFERGFVEDVLRATVKPAHELLENPHEPNSSPLCFLEKLEPQDSPVLARVRKLRERLLRNERPGPVLQEDFYSVASAMVRNTGTRHQPWRSCRHCGPRPVRNSTNGCCAGVTFCFPPSIPRLL